MESSRTPGQNYVALALVLAWRWSGLGVFLEAPFAVKYYIVSTALPSFSRSMNYFASLLFKDFCGHLQVAATNVSNL